ncbi:right-handed parallel beta-helix repeat-containing protein [bacterium]|nr:right-handed parallel beta-helix repeat-containing protein [candidate division CSSED10-310 bacterium]
MKGGRLRRNGNGWQDTSSSIFMTIAGPWRIAVTAILLLCGFVKADTYTVDPSEGQTIRDALDVVSDGDEIILLDGVYIGEGNRGLTIPVTVLNLTIRSDSHAANCIVDASFQNNVIYSQGVNLLIEGITFRNGYSAYGGAIHCNGGHLTVRHCEFHWNEAVLGGGALCLQNMTGITDVSNCLFVQNSASSGGAIFLNFNVQSSILHCTFHKNSAPGSAAIHADHCSWTAVLYSILWNDSPMEVYGENTTIEVNLCDIDQDMPGLNIHQNPLFVSAEFGDHYLAHQYAGYPLTSPCVDTFNDLPVGMFPVISDRTTSPYHFVDTGDLDLGYHYTPWEAFQTPTPTETPTGTPYPTVTPTPTPAYTIELALTEKVFFPDDRFWLEVRVSNWLKQDNPLRLIVVLDVFGRYFMYPSWTEGYDFQYVSIPVGQSGVTVLDFLWPEGAGSAAGLSFYAAFMDTDGDIVISDASDPSAGIAVVEFGFAE